MAFIDRIRILGGTDGTAIGNTGDLLKVTNTPSGTQTISGTVTESNSATRLSESDFDTKTGSLTETAPATDTASSGLNGRLQRVAQRITSLITALGSPFQAGGSIGNTTFASTQSGTWTTGIGNANIVVDTNNTTTATLTANATFTGTATNILAYEQVNVTLFGRPNVAVSGDGSDAKGSLFFEFSPDGTNWDISVPVIIRTLGIFIPYPLITVMKFFRLRYVNDGGSSAITILGTGETAGTPTAQTAFRMTTLLSPVATKELARTVDQGVTGSDPVSLTRGVVMGKNPTNSYVNKAASGLSASNNTTTVLGSGAAFTGVFESILSSSHIAINIDSNLTGTLTIQFSPDGTNVVNALTRQFTQVSGGQAYIVAPVAQYFRVVYTNVTGSGTQSFFRLQTILRSEPMGNIFNPAGLTLAATTLAQVTIAVPTDGVKATYSANIVGLVPAATATDVFTLYGAANRILKVSTVRATATRTANTTTDILLIKRNAANTGGTSTSQTVVPHDSNDIAALGTVLAYTANPTINGTVGTLRSEKIFVNTAGTGASDRINWDFAARPSKSITLRGAAEGVAINMNGATITGGSFDLYIEWTEEIN